MKNNSLNEKQNQNIIEEEEDEIEDEENG